MLYVHSILILDIIYIIVYTYTYKTSVCVCIFNRWKKWNMSLSAWYYNTALQAYPKIFLIAQENILPFDIVLAIV